MKAKVKALHLKLLLVILTLGSILAAGGGATRWN